MPHPLDRQFCRPMAQQRFSVNKEQYELEGHLGDGAAGLVRKAKRLSDGARRAIKFLAPDSKYIDESAFEDVATRFRREGERGARLAHPHLIRIFSYCENEDGSAFEYREPKNPFIIMEQVQGRTLENHIRKVRSTDKRFTISQETLHIGIQVSNALYELHRMRLIHRDVKPANVFIAKRASEGLLPLVKLGDFGIVKWGDFHASVTTGVLTVTNQKGLGTLKYMSPEHAISPRDITVRSDIYPLGITLFELFTGQILSSPHHVYEIMNARLTRGTTLSRYLLMGYHIRPEDEHLAEVLLDMHRRGPTGRPSIDSVRGHLESEYERRYGNDWQVDVDYSSEGFADSWDD